MAGTIMECGGGLALFSRVGGIGSVGVVAMLFPFLTVGRSLQSFPFFHLLPLSFSPFPLSPVALLPPEQNTGSLAAALRALYSLFPGLIARTWRRYDQDPPRPTLPTAPRPPPQQASFHQARALDTVLCRPPSPRLRRPCTPWRATSQLCEPTIPLSSPKAADARFHFQDDSRYGNANAASIPPSISDKVLGHVSRAFRSCSS